MKFIVNLGTFVDKPEGSIRDLLGEAVEQGGFLVNSDWQGEASVLAAVTHADGGLIDAGLVIALHDFYAVLPHAERMIRRIGMKCCSGCG